MNSMQMWSSRFRKFFLITSLFSFTHPAINRVEYPCFHESIFYFHTAHCTHQNHCLTDYFNGGCVLFIKSNCEFIRDLRSNGSFRFCFYISSLLGSLL